MGMEARVCLQHPWQGGPREQPKAGGGGGCSPPPRGWGPQETLVSSLSYAREFLPLDGSIRAKKCLWETLRERGASS